MSLLSPAALSQIRNLVERTMGDSCQRLQRTQTGTDRHGQPVYSYTPGPVLVCGIKAHKSRDAEGTVISDYTVRLPYGTAVDAGDRLRLLGRNGVSFPAPIDGEIVGAPELGLTAVTVQLKVMTYDG